MSKSSYFLTKKKACGRGCEAWWYASPNRIHVYARSENTNEICCVILTRRQLAVFVEKTKPKVKR